jgi:peroxiredoxin
MDDVVVLYVVPASQMSAKAGLFIDAHRLSERVRFLVDPQSRAIDRLGLRRPSPEPIEEGVPHPATYVLDREGVVRFVDVREDFHFWLDPELPLRALAEIR